MLEGFVLVCMGSLHSYKREVSNVTLSKEMLGPSSTEFELFESCA